MDLIDKHNTIDVVNDAIAEYIPLMEGECIKIPLAIARAIMNMPSADSDKDLIHLQKEQAYMQGYEDGRKPRKGKWELHTDERFDIDYYKCSECGKRYEPALANTIINYCYNCGADMTGQEDES